MNTIYIVRHGSDNVRLIDATNPAAAIQFAANPKYVATPAKPRELVDLMAKGIVIEKAKADKGEPT